MLDKVLQTVKGGIARDSVNDRIARGDAARDRRAWEEAAGHYRAALDRNPSLAPIWVQMGHMLKESGRREEAESAYREALALADEADTHLQLGHLHKIMGRRREAEDDYLRALERQPDLADARAELGRMGWNGARLRGRLAPQDNEKSRNALFIDVGDVIFYFGHHSQVTGIQRVVSMFMQIIDDRPHEFYDVEFVAFSQRVGYYIVLDRKKTLLLFDDIRRDGITADISKACSTMAHGDYTHLDGEGFNFEYFSGSTICILGAGWMFELGPILRWAKNKHQIRVAFLIYDLIPITHPQFVTNDLIASFGHFLRGAASIADVFFTISKHVAIELDKYLSDVCSRKATIVPLSLGTFSAGRSERVRPLAELLPCQSYVLFVSTIEIRKNHQLLFDLWSEFLDEGIEVPDLVFVGRAGWKVEDLMQKIASSNYLGGKLHILHDVNDHELEALYKGAQFFVYPSFCEGWGLPVTEAVGFGTPVLSSNATSLPEAGGTVAEYLDPTDFDGWRRTLLEWFREPCPRKRFDFKQHISSDWEQSLRLIINECKKANLLPECPPRLRLRKPVLVSEKNEWSCSLIKFLSSLPARRNEIHEAAEIRIGPNWSFREGWGSWATRGILRISAAVDVEGGDETIVIFARIPDSLEGTKWAFSVNGFRSLVEITDKQVVLCLGGDMMGRVREHRSIYIEAVCIDRTKIDELKTNDQRSPSLGISAMVLLANNDLPSWSILTSTVGEEGRRLLWLL